MIEPIILHNLLTNEDYVRKVLPYLKDDYFSNGSEKKVFQIFSEHFKKYNSLPTKTEILTEAESEKDLDERQFKELKESISGLSASPVSMTWLEDKTEEFCKKSALNNALLKSIQIYEDKSGKYDNNAIPEILKEALSVSFDSSIGHDYLEDAAERWEYYHTLRRKYPFHLDCLNKATGGGLEDKTLNVFMAPTGVGKTIMLCDLSAFWLTLGYNVLYITLEMAEEKISERIDANLLDVELTKLRELKKEPFLDKVRFVKDKSKGKLIVKEYPQGTVSAANFRYLVRELQLKKNFKPDIIVIDYLNICASSRLKRSTENSYNYVKSIAEELRALGQELVVPVVTATQTNRSGVNTSDFDESAISDSFGGPMTFDFLCAIAQTDQLRGLGQAAISILKSRYGEKGLTYIVGLELGKMRFYDMDEEPPKNTDFKNKPVSKKPDDMKGKFNDFKL